MDWNTFKCYLRIRKFSWLDIKCWFQKIMGLFNVHPWDWVAHLILGFFVFIVEWAVLTIFVASVAEILAIWGTINALLFVELTQIDIFWINWRRFGDTVVDLIFGSLGLVFGIKLLVLF